MSNKTSQLNTAAAGNKSIGKEQNTAYLNEIFRVRTCCVFVIVDMCIYCLCWFEIARFSKKWEMNKARNGNEFWNAVKVPQNIFIRHISVISDVDAQECLRHKPSCVLVLAMALTCYFLQRLSINFPQKREQNTKMFHMDSNEIRWHARH